MKYIVSISGGKDSTATLREKIIIKVVAKITADNNKEVLNEF